MATPTKGPRLGGSPTHERLMLANLATSLFEHGRITTTETKAKRLRPFAERLITKARKEDLHNRREIQKVIRDKDVVHRLMTEIGPHFADRPGGYTRITKTVPRKGDNAPMAVIELVPERTATAEAEQARGTRFARDQAPATSAPPVAADAGATAPMGGADTGSGPEQVQGDVTDQDEAVPAVAVDETVAAPAEGEDFESETAEAVEQTREAGAVAESPAAAAPGDAADTPPGDADEPERDRS